MNQCQMMGRNLLMAQKNTWGYVQDGLICLLDGINNTKNGHDASSLLWEDLTDNGYDYQYHNVTINDDHVYFNGGEQTYCDISTVKGLNLFGYSTNVRTIEVVFVAYGSNTANIFCCGNEKVAKGLSLYANSSYTKTCGSKAPQWMANHFTLNQISRNVIHSISLEYNGQTQTNALDNNNLMSLLSDIDGFTNNQNIFRLGGRDMGNPFHINPLLGNIYSFRVYNRLLSDAERLLNYLEDVKRFNL